MRITKKWLKETKVKLQRRLVELCRMDNRQLAVELKRTFPEASIHPTGCPNCGGTNCKCSAAEKARAAADLRPQETIRQAMGWAIEVAMSSHICD